MQPIPKDLASEIYMQYCEYKEGYTYLVLDREIDLNLWRDNLSHKMVKYFVSGSNTNSKKVIDFLYNNKDIMEESVKGVVAIINANYDNILQTNNKPNIIETEYHDFDIVLIFSKSFEKFNNRFCSEAQDLKKNLNVHYCKEIPNDEIPEFFSKFLIECNKPIGILRWINNRKNLNLDFNEIDYNSILNDDLLSVNVNKLIDHILSKKNINVELKKEIKIYYEEEFKKDINPSQICTGLDVLSILAIWVNKIYFKRDSNNYLSHEDLQKILQIGFELDHLKSTELYKSIIHWEKNNLPHKILKHDRESIEYRDYKELENHVLSEILKIIKKHKENILHKSDFLKFLNQIPDIGLRKSMLKILGRVKEYYFTLDQMTLMITSEIKKIAFPLKSTLFLIVLDSLWNKSNIFWSYMIKKVLKINDNNVVIYKSSEFINEKFSISNKKSVFLIFIDDIIGSGKQFRDYYKKDFFELISNRKIKLKIRFNQYIVAGVGSLDSINTISKDCKIPKDRIRYSIVIRETDKAFHLKHWSNESELDNFINYLKLIDYKHWDGWKKYPEEKDLNGQEFLVVLEWNTPNVTISCLWKNLRRKNWEALFPRF